MTTTSINKKNHPAEILRTLQLAIPVVVGMVASFSMNFVDTLMAGRLPDKEIALASIATGGAIWSAVLMFVLGVLMALQPVVAQLDGAGNRSEGGDAARQAMWIALVKNEEGDIQIAETPVAERQKVEEALNNLPADVRGQVDVDKILAASEGRENFDPGFKIDDIQFNEEPWNRETNPVDIRWLPGWLNDRINDEIENSPKKAEQINENPNLLIDKVFDILPATMFLLLPLVALIFKFWYLFAKRYYIEHLIFSLHNHAFLFVGLTLILLANLGESFLTAHNYSAAASAMYWLIVIISIWLPVYMLISLRVVYKQNWFMTLGKFVMIGISYMTLLGLVTTGVAIASFVLL